MSKIVHTRANCSHVLIDPASVLHYLVMTNSFIFLTSCICSFVFEAGQTSVSVILL